MSQQITVEDIYIPFTVHLRGEEPMTVYVHLDRADATVGDGVVQLGEGLRGWGIKHCRRIGSNGIWFRTNGKSGTATKWSFRPASEITGVSFDHCVPVDLMQAGPPPGPCFGHVDHENTYCPGDERIYGE